MDVIALLNSPMLGLISTLVPQAAPVINFLQSHRDVISKAAPVVQAAVNEGRPAFDAALQKAPQFAAALKGFLQQHDIPGSPAGTPANFVTLENTTRMLAGTHKMSPEQERAVANRATPGNDPSEENSKRGSG